MIGPRTRAAVRAFQADAGLPVDGEISDELYALQELKVRREATLTIARPYGVRDLRVFGSVVRGKADAQSEIDFLLELEPGRSLSTSGPADGARNISTARST